jgi:hypothetical protein
MEVQLHAVLLLPRNVKKYITLPSVLDGCESWSVILREKHRLRVFEENGVLRELIMCKRDEVNWECRRLHNEELQDLSAFLTKCYSDGEIKDNEMCEACRTYIGKKCACKLLVGKPAGKRPFGRPRLRWEVLQGIGRAKWSGVIWLRLETSVGIL